MLKDIIKNFYIKKDNPNKDLIPFKFRGELDVKAWKDGNLFYHDGGDNTITIWAKHNMIHLFTGDAFSSLGTIGKNTLSEMVDLNHDGDSKVNTDGMLLSGEQYWWDNTSWNGQWSSSNDMFNTGTANFPFFPTKMLFGTGKEYASWLHVTSVASSEEQTFLSNTWTSSSTFNTNISLTDNFYSGTVNVSSNYQKYGSGPLVPCRTVNDYLSSKIEGSPDQNEYGIVGAIKDGTLTNVDNAKLVNGTTDTLLPEYQGIGKPCFIYCKRDVNWNDSSSDVFISNEGLGYENKITFTSVMPDQVVASNTEDYFYPYNGYTLKEVGLFSDSLVSIGGVADESYPYTNMPCGTMMAKRYIAPLNKTKDVSISASWVLYL